MVSLKRKSDMSAIGFLAIGIVGLLLLMSALFGFNAGDRKQYQYILDRIMSTM